MSQVCQMTSWKVHSQGFHRSLWALCHGTMPGPKKWLVTQVTKRGVSYSTKAHHLSHSINVVTLSFTGLSKPWICFDSVVVEVTSLWDICPVSCLFIFNNLTRECTSTLGILKNYFPGKTPHVIRIGPHWLQGLLGPSCDSASVLEVRHFPKQVAGCVPRIRPLASVQGPCWETFFIVISRGGSWSVEVKDAT